MKDLKFPLAVFLVITTPLLAGIALQPGYWPCAYQVLLQGGMYLMIGLYFGWQWPGDARKFIWWLLIPIVLMFSLSFLGGFAMGLDACWLPLCICSLVTPLLGLFLGVRFTSTKKEE